MSKELVKKEDQDLDLKDSSSSNDVLMAFINRADIDPDRLEKLMNLQIKLEDRQNEQAFNEAMAGFQSECPIIKKTSKVSFMSASGKETKYSFAALDEIAAIIKPILPRHGLSYSFDIRTVDEKKSKVITSVLHKNGFHKASEYEFDTIHDDARMNLSQRRKSAVSFAKRAALENALGIVTANEDDDARRAIDNPVTEIQLLVIRELMVATKTDIEKFKGAFAISRLEDFSEYEAKEAIHALKEKRALMGRPKKEASHV